MATSDDSATVFSLKFLAGKYQGGEFSLEWGREYIIGRATTNELSLVEDLVSRKHARISTKNREIVIEDLGSTNGTFVNGEKVKRAVVKDGDRIVIGTSVLAVGEQASGGTDVDALADETTRAAPALVGSLSELPLTSLVDLVASSRKSGVLAVKSTQDGRIYFRNGQIFFATLAGKPEMPPQKAFFRILGFSEGEYSLERQSPDQAAEEFLDEIEIPVAALLMDGVRQLDEFRHVRASLGPAGDLSFRIPVPLAPPLRELSQNQLDLLQLVINHGTLDAILDASRETDLDAIKVLQTLAKEGYLLVESTPRGAES